MSLAVVRAWANVLITAVNPIVKDKAMVVGMIFFTIGNSCVWISITYTNRTLDLDLKLGQMADRNLNLHYPLSSIRYPLSAIRYPLSAIHYPLSQ
jgi:hypothetical protein